MFSNRRAIIAVMLCLLLAVLCACSMKKNAERQHANLTVSGIYQTIIARKTTIKQLKKLYGEPDMVEIDSKKAINLFNKINNDEGSINAVLEDNTDYWDTVKVDQSSSVKGFDFDGYYEYQGKDMAGLRVYFFVIGDTVRTYWFDGEITDKNSAKKDDYLRQILD